MHLLKKRFRMNENPDRINRISCFTEPKIVFMCALLTSTCKRGYSITKQTSEKTLDFQAQFVNRSNIYILN